MSDETKSWTLTLQKNPYFDDFYIQFPDEMLPDLVRLGWRVDDEIEFIENQDGTITLKKKEQE